MRFNTKKNLGQNFLLDKNLIKKIVDLCQFKKDDFVLEIGPGLGALTGEVASVVKKLIAVEIDARLCKILSERFSSLTNVEILNEDILDFEFPSCKEKIKVLGNLPYYITTPIISYLIKNRMRISEIYLTLQKELAKRIVAKKRDSDYSSFSCYVQYYMNPEILFYINSGAFKPRPKVDSAFMRFIVYEKNPFYVKDESLFLKIIRAGFAHRRKMLKNNLENIFDKNLIKYSFSKLGFTDNIRAQELSVEDFAGLSNVLTENTLVS